MEEEQAAFPRQCTGTSHQTGKRCRNVAMLFQEKCAFHGGKHPLSLKAAEERKLALVEPAIEALWRAVRSAPPCEVCGRSDADRDPATIRAALGVLDRTGHGPSSTVSVQHAKRQEDPRWLDYLTPEQLAQVHQIFVWKREALERLAQGFPPGPPVVEVVAVESTLLPEGTPVDEVAVDEEKMAIPNEDVAVPVGNVTPEAGND